MRDDINTALTAAIKAELSAALNFCAAGARWYDSVGVLTIFDALEVRGLSRPTWLLFARTHDGARYFCPLAQDPRGGWHDIAATAFYQREVLGSLQRAGNVATAGGGRIAFASDLDLADCELLRADAGGSSNTVSQIACGAVTAMHKLYRKLAPQECELEATERLGRSHPALVPHCLGGYRYTGVDDATCALGLLTEYVPGHGLHQDLSASIRALWQLAPEPAHEHIARLLPALHDWRAFIEQLHAAMARELDSAAACAMPGLCAQARERIARIRPQVAGDDLLTPPQRQRYLRILDALDEQVLTPVELPAAPCHGDLHLAHLLWDGADGRRIIDLSPPPAGHPLQDWVAIERALEYFCLDEAALELAPHAGMTQPALMQALLAGLGTDAAASAAIASRMALWSSWHGAVREALCGGHLARTVHAGTAYATTYCARLLQELDYNYSHRRPYYRCIDFYFLAQHFSSLIGE